MSVYDRIELTCGPVVPILSKAIRSQFVADKGNVLYGGDFSNIEGRLNAWFAGEQWKLDAFRDYDFGRGVELYKLAYARSFGATVESVTKPQRQIGKTQELALGYQGSIGAWLRFDPKPDTVTKTIREQFHGTDSWRKAAEQYDRARGHHGLSVDSWIAIKVVINSWRESNSRIVQSWYELQDAAIEAVDAQGSLVPALGGKVAYMVADGFLWCRLPSGKLLAYARPRLVTRVERWLVDADGDPIDADELEEDELAARLAAGATIEEGLKRTQVQFYGKNQKTGAWGLQYLYGGLQCNNVVQCTARELLRFAMHNVEQDEDACEEARAIMRFYHGTAAAYMQQLRNGQRDLSRWGYPIVLHIHDETVSEVAQGFGSVAEYEALMKIVPPWLDGLPLAAKAWTDTRYVK